MQPNEVALRKRSQIAKANRTMFIWIAVASVLVGASLVVGIFLGQQLLYKEKVLAEKVTTVDNLKANNAAIEDLKEEVRILDTNTDLALVKAKPEDQALQVILDALPSEANSLALGASLQSKLLVGIQGLQPVELLQVNVAGGDDAENTDDDSLSDSPPNSISVNFTISGSQSALQELLVRLERSIRTIEITNLTLESQSGGNFNMIVTARAYYEPTKTLELTDKVVER
jgi:hypothetical protein